jgi:hypothetical protein
MRSLLGQKWGDGIFGGLGLHPLLQIATRVGRKEGVEFTCDMAHFVLNRCHTP